MIVGVIRAVFRSTIHTLRTTVGDSAIVDMDVGGDSLPKPSTMRLMAALSPPTGPIRSLLVCCDQRISERIADRLVLPSSTADAPARAVGGFHILCSVLQQNLAAEAKWYEPSSDIVYFGPGPLHPRSSGDRFFRIVARASDAALDVFVSGTVSDMLISVPSQSGPVGLAVEDRNQGTITGAAVDEAFAPLGHTDMDVQVEFPVSRSHTEVHYAKIVSRTILKGHPVLGVFIPAVRECEEFLTKGTEVLTYLPHAGRLYQFRSKVVGLANLRLEGDTHLRLLAVHAPTSLVPGQRRRAFRVNPRSRIPAKIERWIAHGDRETYETATPVSAALYDISLNGARFCSSHAELSSTFAIGNLVLCGLELPDSEPTSIPAIVRRTSKVPTPDGQRYDLAVEFLNNPSWKSFATSLNQIASFVRSEQLRAREST